MIADIVGYSSLILLSFAEAFPTFARWLGKRPGEAPPALVSRR